MSPRWSELIHELTDLRDDRAVRWVVPNTFRVGSHLFPASPRAASMSACRIASDCDTPCSISRASARWASASKRTEIAFSAMSVERITFVIRR